MIFHPPIFRPSIFRPGIFPRALNRPVGDVPSLDLAFALDKTLTARRGPTPTLTRSQTSPTGSTYIGSDGLLKYAAANEPRFDHDPVTLACKGLLIEEQRQNLCLRSEEFNDGIWAKSSAIVTAPVVTANQVNSPSGALSADRIVFPAVSGAGAFSLVTQFFSQSVGVVHTASIYLRGLVGGEKVWWAWTPNGTTYVRKECILTTAWQRFDFTYTSTAGNNFTQLGVDLRDASQSTQSAQTIFAWGAQLEAGSFPTSYIPTTTTALTRSADVCSISGGDFTGMYNQSEGTFICRYAYIKAPSSLQNRRVISGGDTRRIIHGYSLGTNEKSAWYYDGVNNAAMVSGNESAAVGVVIEPTVIHAVCGSFVGPDKVHNGNLLTSMTYIRFFELGSGHIASVKYFRKALTDAKLQSLTAP